MEELLLDIFGRMSRQGPGAAALTRKAFSYVPPLSRRPNIVDMGCGTGAQTLTLAELCDGHITAVDLHRPFLETLQRKALDAGVGDRISILRADMRTLELPPSSLDLIWSEGAVYNIGLAGALLRWGPWLRPGGSMVVSDFTWLAAHPPQAVLDHFSPEVPATRTVEEALNTIREGGFRCLHHFVIPRQTWDDFYDELEGLIHIEKAKPGSRNAQALAPLEEEIDIYRRYGEFFGYSFFIMQRVE